MHSRDSGVMIRVVSTIVGLLLAWPALGSELSRQLDGEGSRSLRQMALAAVRAIGDPPTLYWVIGVGLFSLLIVVSVMPLFLRIEPGRSGRHPLLRLIVDRRFYGWLVGLVVMGLRWPLFARELLNTDESHSIACAMKLAIDPIFWRGIDGTTGGPLLYYPLLLPRLIGLPIEYGSARAMGVLALIASVLLLYGIVRRLFDEGVARLSVLPLITCWALTTSNHFAHYSSEQIPVFLITLALYFLVRWWQDAGDSGWTLVCSGLVLGAIPFAKLQAVPVGLYIAACGVLIIIARYRRGGSELWKRLLVFVASGMAVPIFFMVTIVSTGVWQGFWQSYVLNNLGYGGRYLQLGDAGTSLVQRIWIVVGRSFWTYDLAELVGGISILGLLALLGALGLGRQSLREQVGPLMLAIGLVLVSATAVAIPRTLFSHYFLFLGGARDPVRGSLAGDCSRDSSPPILRQTADTRDGDPGVDRCRPDGGATLRAPPSSATPGLLGGGLDTGSRQQPCRRGRARVWADRRIDGGLGMAAVAVRRSRALSRDSRYTDAMADSRHSSTPVLSGSLSSRSHELAASRICRHGGLCGGPANALETGLLESRDSSSRCFS